MVRKDKYFVVASDAISAAYCAIGGHGLHNCSQIMSSDNDGGVPQQCGLKVPAGSVHTKTMASLSDANLSKFNNA